MADSTVEKLEAEIAEAQQRKDQAIAQLSEQTEQEERLAAQRTRNAKGKELAHRLYDETKARLARDDSGPLPLPAKRSQDKRTGFALLKSNQPTNFSDFVSHAVELIETYGGDVLDLRYALDRSLHFVAITYSMPNEIFDVTGAAIKELKRLHSA